MVETVGVLAPDLRGPEDTLLLEILQKVSCDVDLLQKQAHVVAQILIQSQRLIFIQKETNMFEGDHLCQLCCLKEKEEKEKKNLQDQWQPSCD